MTTIINKDQLQFDYTNNNRSPTNNTGEGFTPFVIQLRILG